MYCTETILGVVNNINSNREMSQNSDIKEVLVVGI